MRNRVSTGLGQEALGAGEDKHLQIQSARSQTLFSVEEEAPGLPWPPLYSLSFRTLLGNVISSEAFPDHPVERILFIFF